MGSSPGSAIFQRLAADTAGHRSVASLSPLRTGARQGVNLRGLGVSSEKEYGWRAWHTVGAPLA